MAKLPNTATKARQETGLRVAFRKIALSDRAVERFHMSYTRGGPDECWPWTGLFVRSGYGKFKATRRDQLTASRVAWHLHTGEQPNGCVCHSCDNPACVNPSHLWLGSHRDNVRDMLKKKREKPWGRSATHCRRGHEYSPDNTRVSGGSRRCKKCCNARARERRAALTKGDV